MIELPGRVGRSVRGWSRGRVAGWLGWSGVGLVAEPVLDREGYLAVMFLGLVAGLLGLVLLQGLVLLAFRHAGLIPRTGVR